MLEEIIRTNGKSLAETVDREGMNKRPTPHLVWVTTPDPQLQPTTLYGDPQDRILILRTMGSSIEHMLPELDHIILTLRSPVLLISSATERNAAEDNRNETPEEALSGAETNVDHQVDHAVKRYTGRVENGRLTVIGAIFDFGDLYGRGAGRQVIININGEKNSAVLRTLPITARMTAADLSMNIGRD